MKNSSSQLFFLAGVVSLLSGCGLFESRPETPYTPPVTRSAFNAHPVSAEAEQLHAKARVLWGTTERCSDPEKAIAYLNSALELEPEYPDALMRRSLAFAQLGLPEEAFEDMTTAIRLAPNAELYAWRARILLDEGNLKGAMQDADEALRMGPVSALMADTATPRAHGVRGAVLLEEGKAKEACAEFRLAAKAGVSSYLQTAQSNGLCE